jgi:hypothetical protein
MDRLDWQTRELVADRCLDGWLLPLVAREWAGAGVARCRPTCPARLEWAWGIGAPWSDEQVAEAAARLGAVDVMDCTEPALRPDQWSVVEAAISAGHVAAAEWAVANGWPLSRAAVVASLATDLPAFHRLRAVLFRHTGLQIVLDDEPRPEVWPPAMVVFSPPPK